MAKIAFAVDALDGVHRPSRDNWPGQRPGSLADFAGIPPKTVALASRDGHITTTGETVPNPGASQSAGTTPLDRGVQNRDNQIDSSICKGC